MARYAMTIDVTTCVACDACVVSCKMENDVPDGFARDWTEERMEGVYPNLKMELYSNRCQHCDNAPCVAVCPTEASYIKDGIVLIDKDKCVGCRHCIAACPYGARYRHPGNYVDKCTFCAHRFGTEKEGTTACVDICPTSSLTFGDLDDPNSPVSKLLAKRSYKVQQPTKGTAPKYILLESIVERKEI